MNELKKLKLMLQNLKNNNKNSVTLDVTWLLDIINDLEKPVNNIPVEKTSSKIQIDGGKFK